MKKTIQVIIAAVSILVSSQSVLAGASDTLRQDCNEHDTHGRIIEGVKISSYIESWTLQDPRSSIKCDYGQEYQISSGINESSYTDATKQQKHQAAMIQGLVQVAYFSGQRVNMCVTDFPRNNTVWLMEIFKYKRLSQFKGITMKAIKKTVQGVVIAISMLVASQSAFVGASDTLRRLCKRSFI